MNPTSQNHESNTTSNVWAWIWLALILSVIAIWIIIGALIPKYQYYTASSTEKCQIDLKKLNDPDKYCDANHYIKSYKEITEAKSIADEAARKAALTPKQRCEEEHKNFADPEGGDYYYVFCKDDGTYSIMSDSEVMSDVEDEIYSTNSSNNYDCDPNYSPCVKKVSYDLDCPDIGFSVKVIGSDPHRFDRDGDGYGCESY